MDLSFKRYLVMRIRSSDGVTLRRLSAFVAVAETGSFHSGRAASSPVGLERPDLESVLGLHLFDRSTRHCACPTRRAELRSRLLHDLDGVVSG